MSEVFPVLQGMARFEIKRQLGAGGMGVVYEAFDKEKDCLVALKTLKHLSPQSILLFKNEFRALANLHHPNLIQLYELFSQEDFWFFSMELLFGQELLPFLLAPQLLSTAETLAALSTSPATISERTVVGLPFGRGALAPDPTLAQEPARVITTQPGIDEANLRWALGQLTRGIAALHSAGKIHRDIKPSNAMVTNEPRVVLMDFGLVREISAEHAAPSVAGTPRYMAPEQAAGRAAGPEADWYALGVILYQSLTGQLPFDGTVAQILLAKNARDADSPRTLRADIPEDLEALCMALLSREPQRRPKGEEILQRLGAQGESRAVLLSVSAASSPFVGREEELTKLKEFFKESQQKREGLSVFVHGESGLGKSALIQKFLASLPEAVLLSGRCYEQESVPYKALDGIVDNLSRYLVKLAPEEAAQVLPIEAALLARVFPVLRQLRAIDGFVPTEIQDPFEQRSRLFSALRELFAKLSARVPLVLFIDDLQWTDNDSLLLLSDLLRPPHAPTLLFVASVRGRGLEDPSIEALVAKLDNVSIQHIQLQGLSPEEVSKLMGLLHVSAEVGSHWSQETGGHPLFIQEMARYGGRQGAAPTKLDEVLLARINRLEEESRRVLELTAVSGAPLPQRLLAQAASLSVASFYQSVLSLRVGQLVRTGGFGEQDPIEPYHDRVRESLVAHMNEPTRKGHHRKLAEVLERSSHQDPQALMRHWEGAAEPQRAAPYALKAAELARAAMAFERAADLYRAALRLGQYPKEDERRLRYLLAESLAFAGRGREAADAFLVAAEGAPKTERLKCQTQAMRQLLLSGRMEDGIKAARALLSEIGGRWPESSAETIATLLWHRAALRLRGLAWREREERDISLEALLLVDVYEQLANGLALVDPIRGALFQSISLRRVLEVGEPRRVVRGLGRECGFIVAESVRNYPRAWAVANELQEYTEQRGDPEMLAWASLSAGQICHLCGRFQEALPLLEGAERRFREQVLGSNAELSQAMVTRLWSLHFLGSFREIARLVPEHIQDAIRRDDRFTETSMTRGFNIVWLIQDDPEEARQRLKRAVWVLPEGTYHFQHWFELQARARLASYEGTGLSPEVEAGFRAFSRSLFARIEMPQACRCFLRGGLLLMDAQRRWFRVFLLREIEKMVQGLYAIPAEYARVWGLLLEAGLARLRGDQAQAVTFFQRAASAADACGLQTEAAVACLRQGEMIGGQAGEALIAKCNEYMAREGIKNPQRFAQLYSPWVS